MRVVIAGATGNIGTSLVSALAADPKVASIVGLARRVPDWSPPKTEWRSADIARDDLTRHFEGADVVVALSWIFQPTHNPITTWRVNVLGNTRLFEAAARAGVHALVYSSSVGAYSPGPKDRMVAEDWPTHGWPTAAYGREKAYLERYLDSFERDHPEMRVVRMRPGFIFKRSSATEQRRIFAGPLVPRVLGNSRAIPVFPDIPGLRFQSLHSEDAGEAFAQAVRLPVAGAFNLAAGPVLDARRLADLLQARLVPVPAALARAALWAAWHLHLAPASPYLLDLFLRVPLMDTTRARADLEWSPRHTSVEAIESFLAGLRAGDDLDTPPLSAGTSGPLRSREFATGVGQRNSAE
ncbi:NAD-dependent epimerase/dehydratase family protein [Bailinhaonella thermotolerans]|uniref:NAD-dependent epimerase/dehydratase family protein n=1 Tax=Bailinhaonella thermotolerans TaxID=1070861 RepID=A0A3A4B542_9ACTN|nr:NAD-dependent epimerase/dehydratase family protein [Bailinhaonella thermotolerans]RJL33191.1 NAD-dependent epimerase/dehydratase family protein [Bailinhaonella thermotolerans]